MDDPTEFQHFSPEWWEATHTATSKMRTCVDDLSDMLFAINKHQISNHAITFAEQDSLKTIFDVLFSLKNEVRPLDCWFRNSTVLQLDVVSESEQEKIVYLTTKVFGITGYRVFKGSHIHPVFWTKHSLLKTVPKEVAACSFFLPEDRAAITSSIALLSQQAEFLMDMTDFAKELQK